MVHVRIATGAEQPINRDAAVSTIAGEEGDLVGMDAAGDWVAADADSGVAQKASGILAAPVTDPSDYPHEELRLIIESERELIGENRIAVVKYGVIVENADEDWGFVPGEPVYLAPGSGFTQAKPSAVGDLVQIVGEATDDGEALFLDVETGYEVVA
jgi:hypothetical protein